MSLKKLFIKYNSDKFHHKYYNVYDVYLEKLKKKKLNILEIGVADGSSVKAWSDYFVNSKIIGIDIKKIDITKKKLNKKNIFIYQGSQSNNNFINFLIKKYKKFDIIIDDGSHFPNDVIKSFKLLFHALNNNGIYFVEDTQTSYNHYFGGNPFDLKYSKTHINFFKNLTDSLNYQEIANPFYLKSGYDGYIKNISFYNNMIVVTKGLNNIKSNLVLNNSYENKRYNTKINRSGSKLNYFLKYKIFFKLYTLFLFSFNFLKKMLLFRY
jgi:23S rRNA U2552 (ribose-2'-O)-methylase RlmE/FtsJ